MAKSRDSLSFDANSPTLSFKCVNCSAHILPSNYESIKDEERESKLIVKALFSVFKLHFLDAFDSFENQEEENPITLCVTCRKVLVSIFDLYTKFCHLTKVDSYLSKKLLRLDGIIERHRKKTIHCDLIQNSFVGCEESLQGNEDNDYFHLQESSLIVEETEPLVVMDKNGSESDDDDPDSHLVSPSDEEELGIQVKYENCGDDDETSEDERVENEDHNPLEPEPEIKLEIDMSSGNDNEHLQHVEPSTSSKLLESQAAQILAIKSKFKYLFQKRTGLAGSRSKRFSPYKIIPRPDRSKEENQTFESVTTRSHKSSISSIFQNDSKHHDDTNTGSNTSRISQQLQHHPIKNVERAISSHRVPVDKNSRYLWRKSKVPNPCWHCDLDFSTPEECLEHTKNVHGKQFKNVHLCLNCSKICPTPATFSNHKMFCKTITRGKIAPLQKNFQCEKCAMTFLSLSILQSHLDKVHTNVRAFPCDLCSYTAKTSNVLRNHKKYMHRNIQPEICCELCGRWQKRKSQLKLHMLVKHPQEGQEEERALFLAREKALRFKRELKKPIKPQDSTVCQDCQVDMFSKLALINHRASVHQDNMDRNWICEKCGHGFENASRLKNHIQNVHVEERKFTCHICGKSFKNKDHLIAHEARSHTEEGRLKYNQLMREKNQRKKLRESLLAQLSQDKTSQNVQSENDESSSADAN